MKILVLFYIIVGFFRMLECSNNNALSKNQKVVKLPEKLYNSNNSVEALIKENNQLKKNNSILSDEKTQLMSKIEILQKEIMRSKEDQIFVISWLMEKVLLNNSVQIKLLHEASQFGYAQVIEVLVKAGVKIDSKDQEGNTPLHLASWSGQEKTIKTLLDKGATIDLKNNEGKTPLHIASSEGYFEVVKTLVHRGANVNEKDKYGETPFDLACQNPRAVACDEQAIKDYLKSREGIIIQEKGKSGQISLFEAARLGQVKTIKLLLDKGVNINSNDSDGRTPLHIASREGYLEAVKVLVERGANFNQKDKYGQTAFDITCQNPRAVSCDAQSIKDYLKSKETRMGKILPNLNIPGEVLLFEASRLGQIKVISNILDKGVDVNAKDIEERTPLHIASREGHLEAVKFLVERGANVTAKDKYGMTPFNLVCQNPRAMACNSRAIKNYLQSKNSIHPDNDNN